jgi:hypothetical protein
MRRTHAFRGFTHYLSFDGGLIFGTRTYQSPRAKCSVLGICVPPLPSIYKAALGAISLADP